MSHRHASTVIRKTPIKKTKETPIAGRTPTLANSSITTLIQKIKEQNRKPKKQQATDHEREKRQEVSGQLKTKTTDESHGMIADTVTETVTGSPRQQVTSYSSVLPKLKQGLDKTVETIVESQTSDIEESPNEKGPKGLTQPTDPAQGLITNEDLNEESRPRQISTTIEQFRSSQPEDPLSPISPAVCATVNGTLLNPPHVQASNQVPDAYSLQQSPSIPTE